MTSALARDFPVVEISNAGGSRIVISRIRTLAFPLLLGCAEKVTVRTDAKPLTDRVDLPAFTAVRWATPPSGAPGLQDRIEVYAFVSTMEACTGPRATVTLPRAVAEALSLAEKVEGPTITLAVKRKATVRAAVCVPGGIVISLAEITG
jgi:hypothetical protein